MYIAPMRTIDSQISASEIFGGFDARETLAKINSAWSNGSSVIFGSVEDPLRQRFSQFNNAIVKAKQIATDIWRKTYDSIMQRDNVVPLMSEDELIAVPPIMHVPILTYPPIRKHLDEGVIFGWGVDSNELPQEDVAGRLINNGSVVVNQGDEVPEYLKWDWSCTDPDFTFEELDTIEDARIFISSYLEDQMGPDGELMDPTDMLHRGTIGKIL